jgi:hypothetical protein
MIRASWQIRIERPAEEIFDFVADLRNEPQFNPDASNIEQQTPGPVGLGTVWTEDFRRIGRYETTIDEYERPAKLGFDARNPKTDAVVRFSFEPQGDAATDVSCVVELTMKGAMRLMEPLMASMIRRQIEQTRGPMLKKALEQ